MKQLKITACALLVLLAAGFAFTGNSYEEKEFHIRLRPGETIEGVTGNYYDKEKSGECWESFRWRQLEANKHLWANDRWPQVGDDVVVLVREKK